MKEKIYWMRGEGMKKYHAFTVDSSISLCGHWFMGFATLSGMESIEMLPKRDREKSKCKECKRRSER